MAFTQAELAALEKAMAAGVMEVRYGDRTVKYRSLAEMKALRQTVQQELGQLQNGGFRFYTPGHSKGLR